MNSETDLQEDWLPIERGGTAGSSHRSGPTAGGPTPRLRAAVSAPGPRRPNPLQYLPFDPWRLAETLRVRGWWLAAGAIGLGLLGFLFGMAVFSARYTATVQLIRNEGANAFRASEFGEAFRPQPLSEVAFRSMARSPEVLRRVSQKAQPPVSVKALSDRLRLSPDRNVDFIAVTLAGFAGVVGALSR